MLRKETINQESYTQQIYLSKIKMTKTSPDKQKLRESVASRHALWEILKEFLQAESKWPQTASQIHRKSTDKGH